MDHPLALEAIVKLSEPLETMIRKGIPLVKVAKVLPITTPVTTATTAVDTPVADVTVPSTSAVSAPTVTTVVPEVKPSAAPKTHKEVNIILKIM